jgi:hypothetical protein
MSYLKIYPKRIIATLDADGCFEGVFTLHIEQYGLQALMLSASASGLSLLFFDTVLKV